MKIVEYRVPMLLYILLFRLHLPENHIYYVLFSAGQARFADKVIPEKVAIASLSGMFFGDLLFIQPTGLRLGIKSNIVFVLSYILDI